MSNTPHVDVEHFADTAFLTKNIYFVDKYAALRVRAVHSHAAFRRVFGSVNCDNHVHIKIQCIEASDLYCDLFDAKLKAIPVNEMITDKKAIHAYMEIASNPHAKDSAKIAALREVCVLANITVIDENGKTKMGRSLEDFYKDTPANELAERVAAEVANPKPREPANGPKLH